MGGQKTIGVIHGEAFELVKKNYVTMLLISLVMIGVSFVLNAVFSIITAPLGMFSGIFSSLSTLRFDHSDLPSDLLPTLASLLPLFGIMGVTILISFAIGIIEGIALLTAKIGAYHATLRLLDGEKPTFNGTWQNFITNWKRYLGITAWATLWTFLWKLLLIIPGYIKSLSYRFAPFLMIQYPDMKIKDALKKSMEMTNGYKGRLFGLDLILFGYGLAMVLLFCLILPLFGFIFWLPLMTYAMYTIAYLDIKKAAIDRGLLPPASSVTSSSDAPVSL